MAAYFVKTEDKQAKDWNRSGMWILGSREHHNLEQVYIASRDEGNTFYGEAAYAGERIVKVKCERKHGNVYVVKLRDGGLDQPWMPDGTWVIGAPANKPVVELSINSEDKGDSLVGKVTFLDELAVGFKASVAGVLSLTA